MRNFLTVLSAFLVGSLVSLGVGYAIYTPLRVFPDVNYNDYYGNALRSIQGKGIINGYANGNFGPNDPVTRAQLVTILDKFGEIQLGPSYPERLRLICTGINKENFSVNQGLQDLYKKYCERSETL